MEPILSSIYKSCIYTAFIAFIIGFFTTSTTSFGAYIAGYSVLILGIMLILVVLFANILKFSANNSMLQVIMSVFSTAGPFILIFGVISFMLYLLITYKNIIIQGNTAPGYNSFTNITVMLLLIQLYMIYGITTSEKFETSGKMSMVQMNLIYLLGVITAISTIILHTILKYYTTDGFTN